MLACWTKTGLQPRRTFGSWRVTHSAVFRRCELCAVTAARVGGRHAAVGSAGVTMGSRRGHARSQWGYSGVTHGISGSGPAGLTVLVNSEAIAAWDSDNIYVVALWTVFCLTQYLLRPDRLSHSPGAESLGCGFESTYSRSFRSPAMLGLFGYVTYLYSTNYCIVSRHGHAPPEWHVTQTCLLR